MSTIFYVLLPDPGVTSVPDSIYSSANLCLVTMPLPYPDAFKQLATGVQQCSSQDPNPWSPHNMLTMMETGIALHQAMLTVVQSRFNSSQNLAQGFKDTHLHSQRLRPHDLV